MNEYNVHQIDLVKVRTVGRPGEHAHPRRAGLLVGRHEAVFAFHTLGRHASRALLAVVPPVESHGAHLFLSPHDPHLLVSTLADGAGGQVMDGALLLVGHLVARRELGLNSPDSFHEVVGMCIDFRAISASHATQSPPGPLREQVRRDLDGL